jgi:hypothetical protein
MPEVSTTPVYLRVALAVSKGKVVSAAEDSEEVETGIDVCREIGKAAIEVL